MTKQDLAPFYKELRKLGFKRWDDSGRGGDNYCVQYEKEYPADKSKVNVQFWPNAGTGHRVSHFHPYVFEGYTSPIPYGHMNSYPSGFSTVEGMLKAIEFERTRYLRGIDKHVSPDFK